MSRAQRDGWVVGGAGILIVVAGALLTVTSPVALVYRLLGSGHVFDPQTLEYLQALGAPTLALGVGLGWLGVLLVRRPGCLTPPVVPERHPAWHLVLVSVVALFFELLMIRWLASEVRLFAYFKNMTLICSFLGLGVGCAFARAKRDSLPLFLVVCGLLVLIGASPWGKLLGSAPIPGGETEFFWTLRTSTSLLTGSLFYVGVGAILFLQVALFIPLGQTVGRCLLAFLPLTGYSLNILGSLAGIWLFTVLAAWWSLSTVWFTAGLLGYLALVWRYRPLRPFHAVLAACVCIGVWLGDAGSVWSPYYKMTVTPASLPVVASAKSSEAPEVPWGFRLAINHIAFIEAVDLSPAFVMRHREAFPWWQTLALTEGNRFDLPFRLAEPREVLIIGSGLGMDVAGALRHGADRVDAVDIDPMMFVLGQRLHPERPYDSPRVRRITDDARAFFHGARAAGRRYDLIDFAALDSRALMSSASSVRLDSYLYTRESFAEARQLLRDDGILVLYFYSVHPWIAERLGHLLREPFPDHPLLTNGRSFFISGPGLGPLEARVRRDPAFRDTARAFAPTTPEGRLLPTDDRPFLYLKRRTIPLPYLGMMAELVVLTLLVVRRAYGGYLRLRYHFFFLGAAFLLMETAGVTTLALLFGTTWWVNTLVFSNVLVMILAANQLSAWRSVLPLPALYGGLAATLLLQRAIPLSWYLTLSFELRLPAAGLVFGAPFFFAALVFARSLRATAHVPEALGSNLLGAVVGGCLEYLSLYLGLGALPLLALGLYGISWACRRAA